MLLLPPPCKSGCKKASVETVPAQDKAGDSGKKQSTQDYKFAPDFRDSLTSLPAAILFLSPPFNCEASIMDSLCSAITGFLDDEDAKTDATVKSCKKNCGWKKRKDDLIDSARKKAKESCARGEAPDINDINKGLDGNAKARLKNLYDSNSRMFDGTAKLPAKDLEPVPSNNAATLPGRGGQVTDLKSYEPNTPKLNPTAEFSLSGTKLSGETSNPAAAKQSAGLLASAAQTKASADTTAGSSSKSPTTAAASDKATVSAAEPQTCAECKQIEPNLSRRCLGICCAEAVKKYPKDAAKQSDCYTLCTGITAGAAAQCKCCQDYNSLCTTFVSGCTPGGGPLDWLTNLWHKLKGDKKCGETWYDPDKECCFGGTIVAKQKCAAGSTIGIDGPSDLILHNPSNKSESIPLSVRGTTSCPCPEKEKVQWSSSSKKIKFMGATNQATVQVAPVSESGEKDDISVTVTVDGITSPPKKLTVRRPKIMSHPDLKHKIVDNTKGWYIGVGSEGFYWTLRDQFGDPMPGILVKEKVRKVGASFYVVWRLWPFDVINKEYVSKPNGTVPDIYFVQVLSVFDSNRDDIYCAVHQDIDVIGYTGDADIRINMTSVSGTTPVHLEIE